MVTLYANPNQAPTRMAPIRYSDVDKMPKPSFQPFGGNPGFGGLSQAPMFGGIGGLFNRFSRMDDETYSRGMDRYGQFRDRFGGGYQPNMFSNFAGMDDETFSRGMDRLGNYADRYGQGNPMFRGYKRQDIPHTGTINEPSQPFIDPPVTGGPTPLPMDAPNIPDGLTDRGVAGPILGPMSTDYAAATTGGNPGAATDNLNRQMNDRLRQQGFGAKGGGSQPPQNTPYYGTQFAGRMQDPYAMQNPYASGYGMGYQTPQYNQNSGKGGSRSQNPYSGRPAGGGKGGSQPVGGYGI